MTKARRAGALYEGRSPSFLQRNPKVEGSVNRKIFGNQQRKGCLEVEMTSKSGRNRESLRGLKAQESNQAPT